MLEPGTFLWSSPHGYQFLRDHEGTSTSPPIAHADCLRPRTTRCAAPDPADSAPGGDTGTS
ncbi:MAG: hypothetical protein JWR85_500 [Marmoricola sp.]|nr:hypothetical protein [Marmoricola sp.]